MRCEWDAAIPDARVQRTQIFFQVLGNFAAREPEKRLAAIPFCALHLHFIASIAILFFLCIIFISFYLFAFALTIALSPVLSFSVCLLAVGGVM